LEGVNLSHAHTDSKILLDGSRIDGNFAADGLHAENDLSLAKEEDGVNGVVFKGAVRLDSARIDGDVDMRFARIERTLGAEFLRVGSSFNLDKASAKQDFVLSNAALTGSVFMRGASFGGKLDAYSLQVGGSRLMYSDGPNKASFKEVVLVGAE